MNKRGIASVAGALMLTAITGTTPAMAQAPQSGVREDLRPGDRVEHGGAGVHVGPRGTFTAMHMDLVDGGHTTLLVLTRPDGTVVVDNGEAPASEQLAPQTPLSSSPPACEDGAYNLSKWSFSGTQKSYKWKSQFDWYFKANSTPSEVTVSEARTKFTEAAGNITASRNDCGLADEVGATHSRVGDTTAGTDFNASGTLCQSYSALDNKSVAGWGTVPSTALGIACTWGTWNGTDTYATAEQSDVRLNPDYHWYGSAAPAVCLNTDATEAVLPVRYFSIEDVMTHERGHTFGVGHVSEATHANLTMSEQTPPCQNEQATLGLGDVRALRALY